MAEHVFDVGNTVICDICSKDWTNAPADDDNHGGFLLQSKAVCPECACEMSVKLQICNEMHFVRDLQREDETFQQACLRWRGGNNQIKIVTIDNIDEAKQS